MKRAIFAAALGLLRASAAHADVSDLNRNLPLEMEDAEPPTVGSLQFQAIGRYEQTSESQDQFRLEPQVQYAPIENAYVQSSAPFYFGDADRSGSGDVDVRGLYQLVKDAEPAPWAPGVAVAGELIFPTGVRSDGLDTVVELLVSKGLTDGGKDSPHRVHLNVRWEHNAAAASDERANRFTGVLGYGYRLDDKTMLLADVVREQLREERQDATLVEVGAIGQFSDQLQVAAGLGGGLGDDAPHVRVTLGAQYEF